MTGDILRPRAIASQKIRTAAAVAIGRTIVMTCPRRALRIVAIGACIPSADGRALSAREVSQGARMLQRVCGGVAGAAHVNVPKASSIFSRSLLQMALNSGVSSMESGRGRGKGMRSAQNTVDGRFTMPRTREDR